jgi:hypothetical protein
MISLPSVLMRQFEERTAPPVPTTSMVPLIRCADLRCTQVIEAHSALTGKVCAHSRYRRRKLVGLIMHEAVARTK